MATRQRISTQDPLVAQLRNTQSIEQLVHYLHDELDWPVDLENLDDVFFEYEPEELNLKAEHTIAIRSIRQLRPLTGDQPWGIFFVEFDRSKLPTVVLRRVLQGLAIKRRERDGGRQRWHAQDLLFVSTWGEPGHKEIAFAHFAADQQAMDAPPVLRVLGWDESDTNLQMANIVATLRQNLSWPATGELKDAWRQRWSGAFKLRPGQTISDAKTLAAAMALFAKRIRVRVLDVLLVESAEGRMHKLWEAFRTSLIADLKPEDFADMFAQTVTYGLFAQRIMRESGAITADGVVESLGGTNPFLRELLTMFLEAGGHARRRTHRVDFDELGINDAMEMMLVVNTEAIRLDFNKTKPNEDPVIHLYEDFLTIYDKAKKIERGVFYTPKPVVQFIVRSVHEVLQRDFDLVDGLASTETWGDVMARRPGLTLPQHTTRTTPFVQVLDPATGTATFLVEAISLIHEHLKGKWRAAGQSKVQIEKLWQDYVGTNLLPRLFGYELQMAPYAIAHMKVALTLANSGYSFPAEPPRINIYLTNALEPSREVQASIESLVPALAHEARAANRVKEEVAVTVVIGNPPYQGKSSNKGPWITNLMRSRLPDGADHYFRFNNADLGERNPKWVNNDYVKFFRLAQWRLAETSIGVLGYITSNSYLESPTFRGVRQSLLHSLPHLRIVDLHGNSKRGETAGGDENVFEITEGVAIAIGNVAPGLAQHVEHADLTGTRQTKYETLMAKGLQILTPLTPSGARLQLVRSSSAGVTVYECGWPLPTIFPLCNSGMVSKRNSLAFQIDKEKVQSIVKDIHSLDHPEIVAKYPHSSWDSRDGKVEYVKSSVLRMGLDESNFIKCLYRPFDERWTYYTAKSKGFLAWPVHDVMRHMLTGQNLGLISCRQMSQFDEDWSLVGTTRRPIECCTISNKTKEINYLFPLWRDLDETKAANLSPSFIVALQSALNLTAADCRPEDPAAPLQAEKIFHYIYAVLHSPAYRQRYAAFLRTDFPRIPIPGSLAVFNALAALGEQLVQWHLLEHPDAIKLEAAHACKQGDAAFFGTDFELKKVAEKGKELAEPLGGVGKVYINATSGFENVHQPIWQHTIGGYQVLHKWLDDRRKAKRSLSQDDVTHWLRIYASLEATQKLMLQVDEAIEANGDWPEAFSQDHPPPDAATLAIEQMAQKEQLKAQKKAATATKKRAGDARNTRAIGLFDSDDDLDELAEAAGAPPRPKARATPAKAAGGKVSTGLYG
jgi:Type ISP C-terminal specificity domain